MMMIIIIIRSHASDERLVDLDVIISVSSRCHDTIKKRERERDKYKSLKKNLRWKKTKVVFMTLRTENERRERAHVESRSRRGTRRPAVLLPGGWERKTRFANGRSGGGGQLQNRRSATSGQHSRTSHPVISRKLQLRHTYRFCVVSIIVFFFVLFLTTR